MWRPLADALPAADDLDMARELYEQIAASSEYDEQRRTWAAERAEALGRDDSVISGEIETRPALPKGSLPHARELAEQENWEAAIREAERVAEADGDDVEALELLEKLYLETGDITAASEAIGRQLLIATEPEQKAKLWRRRAKIYRDAPPYGDASAGPGAGARVREAEAYRCLKEAHAHAPADPDIAYQLRTAAMVRGEWALAASLLYREIAAAPDPRERGALHLELAMIFEEKLGDGDQAQVNYEQALAFDPTIPAAKIPLARRYEQIGRYSDAARLFLEAGAAARPADRPALIEAAAKNRAAANAHGSHGPMVAKIEHAEADGDTDAALDLAHQLWRAESGHPIAFRVLSNVHRVAGDLDALTEITTLFSARVEAPDERATAWLAVATLAEELGKLEQAARAYDLALIEEPGHAGALDARGALAFRLGDWSTADLIYRDLAPEDSVLGTDDLALRRSVIAENLGRHEEALELAKQAAAAAPGRYDVMMRVQHLATATGELRTAIGAAHAVLDLIPLTDDDAALRTRHALVDLHRMVGEFDEAIRQLETIVRDHPHHSPSIELLAEMHIAKGDWPTATRYLFQLVPLAPTAQERADRLYRLGEAVLLHLGDIDRADDVFLRASDLDPRHVPTLRRLLDVYWRADDPGALVEVAGQLAKNGGLAMGPVAGSSLAQALVAAALVGETELAAKLVDALGEDAPPRIVSTLGELVHRRGKFELASASTAISELGRRGVLDVQKLRLAASGTPVERVL
jgi:tetratricopeptide (TPR) repeat protein